MQVAVVAEVETCLVTVVNLLEATEVEETQAHHQELLMEQLIQVGVVMVKVVVQMQVMVAVVLLLYAHL